jgi:hypothetical protein
MPEMMPLTERHATAREAATTVPILQRPAQGGRYRPRSRPDLSDPPIRIVLHDDPGRVTGQALGRFRGNVCAGFKYRLPWLIWVRQHGRVHMHHHLVVLRRMTRVESLVKCRLCHQRQRVCPLLSERGPIRRLVGEPWNHLLLPPPLVQRLARCLQGLHEKGSYLGSQPSPDDHCAVLVVVDVKPTACVLSCALASFRVSVDPPPAADDPFNMTCRSRTTNIQEAHLCLWRRHPCERPYVCVR